LDGFADDSDVPLSYCNETFKRAKGTLDKTVDELLEHYKKTFMGEQALRNEDGRALWNPIVNVGDEEGDPGHRAKGVGWYSSTRALLMDDTEGKQETVWASRRRAMLDAWAGQITNLLVYGRVGGRRCLSQRLLVVSL